MFYVFHQNNSGGTYNFSEALGIGTFVIVEADDYNEANERAKDIGLYFDGVYKGIDCECCGDRWCPIHEWEKPDNVPSIYDTPLKLRPSKRKISHKGWGSLDVALVFVHYKDGSILRTTYKNRYYHP